MKSIKIYITIFSLFLISGLFFSSLNAQTPHKKFKKIQKFMDEATSDKLTGIVVYIKSYKHGKWIGTSGFSSLENKTHMTKENVFSLASIGKTYTAVTVLKLIEDGKLGLDDKIENYLPKEIIDGIPNSKQVTIRHLLSHTSGFYNYNTNPELNELYISGNLKLDTLSHMDALRRYAYGIRPNTKSVGTYQYCSTNYLLLTMIMDNVLLEGHEEYLRKSIFSAFNFNNSYYKQTPKKHLVDHYGDLEKDGEIDNLSAQTIETTNWYSGDDGVYAPVEEAAEFLEMLMKGEILNDASLKEMTKWNNEKYLDYGLGLMAGKSFPYKISIGHSGRGIGITTDLYYFPKQDITIAIFCNTGLRSGPKEYSDAYYKMRNRIVKKIFLF